MSNSNSSEGEVKMMMILAVVVCFCLFLSSLATGGLFYYNKSNSTSSSSNPNSTSSTSTPTDTSSKKPFTSTETVMSNLFPNLQKGFLEYKVNMTDGTKWAMQERSVQVLINEYKRINADKTTTDEYQKVIQYETEFDKLKTTRNAALVSAQCPAGPYPVSTPSKCATLYGETGNVNETGCKADPKCKLVKDVFTSTKQCMACDEPKLTSGLYTIL